MIIRAKFQLQEHSTLTFGGDAKQHKFVFRAWYDPTIEEDQRFSLATPSAEMTLFVDNPAVVKNWTDHEGQLFYVDIVQAELKPSPDGEAIIQEEV